MKAKKAAPKAADKQPVASKKTAVKKAAGPGSKIAKAAAKKPRHTALPAAPGQPKRYSFFEDVWDVVRQIPAGRVTNYGAIARYLGSGLSSRMVGWAMNAVGGDDTIPAQRVVNRNGMLSGKAHFGGNRMEELLIADGLEVKNDTVVDYKKIHWDPAEELGL